MRTYTLVHVYTIKSTELDDSVNEYGGGITKFGVEK